MQSDLCSFVIVMHSYCVCSDIETMAEEDSEIDFSTEWQYGDICFVVEGKKVYANKMILSMWSPVFKAMFSHDFKVCHVYCIVNLIQ